MRDEPWIRNPEYDIEKEREKCVQALVMVRQGIKVPSRGVNKRKSATDERQKKGDTEMQKPPGPMDIFEWVKRGGEREREMGLTKILTLKRIFSGILHSQRKSSNTWTT